MKIIKKGTPKKKVYKKTCSSCKTKFEYEDGDIKSDRDSYYVICPLESCKKLITVGEVFDLL